MKPRAWAVLITINLVLLNLIKLWPGAFEPYAVTRISDLEVTNKIQLTSSSGPTFSTITSDPNGVVLAARSSLRYRTDTNVLYVNTDGAMAWTKVQQGSLTAGTIPRATAVNTQGDSSITDTGTDATATGQFDVTNGLVAHSGLTLTSAVGPTFKTIASDPSGSVIEPRGSLRTRTDSSNLYLNQNGGTTWLDLAAVFTSTLNGLAPASGGGTTNFLRADGTWNRPAAYTNLNYPFFGDGLDGSLTFDGTTTILGIVPSANTYVLTHDIAGTTITVNSGVSIRFAGYRMMATTSITNNGTKVGNYGIDAVGSSPAAACGAGVIGTGVSGVAGSVGPNNGTGGIASGGVYTGFPTLAAAAAGAGGGSGQGGGGGGAGAQTGGTGGATTRASTITGRFSLAAGSTGQSERGTTQFTWASSGGSGAVTGGTNGASAGTGGGGCLTYVAAPLITGTGRFTSAGGAPGTTTLGNSTGVGGSGGSGGGWIVIIYATRTGSLSIDANGSSPAAPAGTGNTGGSGGNGIVTLINISGDGT